VPFALSHNDLRRGQERYTIYCTPCHGQLGDGNGMVVQRGLRQAASYHQDRLRQERIGYFFDVITNGFGAMQGYAEQVPVRDRWLIAAYIRALQLSQNASLNEVPAEQRSQMGQPSTPATPQGTPPPASGTGQPAQRPEGTKQ
jgi:mono/diheme cytochrome c family protein